MEDLKCPIYPGRSKDKNGRCKRSFLCSDEDLLTCGAVSDRAVRRKKLLRKQAGCIHKTTKLVATDRYVNLDGVKKKIFRAVCSECQYEKDVVM